MVEERVTIQNPGSATLDSGSLEITLPSQVELQSANPGNYQYDNGNAIWSVALAPKSSVEIRYVLMPVASGQDLVTKVKFSVNGQTLAETQAISNIGEVQGAVTNVPVADTPELPRTGLDPMYVVLILVIPFVLSRLIALAKKSC